MPSASDLPAHAAPAVSVSLPAIPAVSAGQEPEASEQVVHFSARNMSEKSYYLNAIKQNQISTALGALPPAHAKSVESITIDYNPDTRRGMGGNNQVILRGVNMGAAEMIAVLVHEVGHNVDYDYLLPAEEISESGFVDGGLTLYESDPSVDFYRISWTSNYERSAAAKSTDFVSGYAMSDCFEDFAESYVFYVLHNKDFKRLAVSSEALYAKYRFMKYQVFGGVEFDTGDGLVSITDRPWDITVLDYDISRFLS
jgi:hypothetical protein